MTDSTTIPPVRPFEGGRRRLQDPDPERAALRAAGPLVRAELPGGATAWVVTEEAAARRVLTDPRFSKDTAHAPHGIPGLEPPAAERPSLTTAEGAAHTRLRRAHAPLLSQRALAGREERTAATARTLLTALGPGEVDLMADFTTRYPLTVVLDLVGAPPELLDRTAEACRAMWSPDPAEHGRAFAELLRTSRAAVGRPGLASELRDRLGDLDDDEIGYLVFGLVFAGQLTTDAALGSLLATALERGLTGTSDADLDRLVHDVLRRHPPAPFTLWRFATEPVDLGGVRLPAGAPVLIDIRGTGTGEGGPGLSFGYGPHFCAGAHLARLELHAVLTVLRTSFPQARLAVRPGDLVEAYPPGPVGGRLTALPVVLR